MTSSTPSPHFAVSSSSASLPSSPLATNSEKSRRYDRQLRLWGDHGQRSLEAASVCLVRATATGCELLKSLVLPGLGAFTIVDERKVGGEDVGNNFFLEREGGNSIENCWLEFWLEVWLEKWLEKRLEIPF